MIISKINKFGNFSDYPVREIAQEQFDEDDKKYKNLKHILKLRIDFEKKLVHGKGDDFWPPSEFLYLTVKDLHKLKNYFVKLTVQSARKTMRVPPKE
jgi:hypothetical protein